jgi:hypothetical protein
MLMNPDHTTQSLLGCIVGLCLLVSSPLIWNVATYMHLVSMYIICRGLLSQLSAMSRLPGKSSAFLIVRRSKAVLTVSSRVLLLGSP